MGERADGETHQHGLEVEAPFDGLGVAVLAEALRPVPRRLAPGLALLRFALLCAQQPQRLRHGELPPGASPVSPLAGRQGAHLVAPAVQHAHARFRELVPGVDLHGPAELLLEGPSAPDMDVHLCRRLGHLPGLVLGALRVRQDRIQPGQRHVYRARAVQRGGDGLQHDGARGVEHAEPRRATPSAVGQEPDDDPDDVGPRRHPHALPRPVLPPVRPPAAHCDGAVEDGVAVELALRHGLELLVGGVDELDRLVVLPVRVLEPVPELFVRAAVLWDGRSQELIEVVPEVELVPRHAEARAEEEGSADAHEGLVWEHVCCGGGQGPIDT